MSEYTPMPGDYIRADGLTEWEYHQVAELFMGAGARMGEHTRYHWRDFPLFGWHPKNGCFFAEKCHQGGLNGTELTLMGGKLVPAQRQERWEEVRKSESHSLTNAELAEAIETAHAHARRSTGESYRNATSHLESLRRIQLERARHPCQ